MRSRRDRPVNSQLVNLIPLMVSSEILRRINIAIELIPVPLGYCWPRLNCGVALDGRGRLQNGRCIFWLVRLPGIWYDASPIRPYRCVFRIFCCEEAEHDSWVPNGRKNDGYFPHLHVFDCQVFGSNGVYLWFILIWIA